MRGIEKLLHKRYKERRIPQTEYFRLTPEEVEEASYLLGGGDLPDNDSQSVLDEETKKAAICFVTGIAFNMAREK